MLKRCLVVAILLVVSHLSASEEPNRERTPSGKYQTQVYNKDLYLIDTTTGMLWRLDHYTWGGYRWTKISVELPQNE